eukprot:scaffold327_cov189-Alexandrium_tamarense.AAC.12
MEWWLCRISIEEEAGVGFCAVCLQQRGEIGWRTDDDVVLDLRQKMEMGQRRKGASRQARNEPLWLCVANGGLLTHPSSSSVMANCGGICGCSLVRTRMMTLIGRSCIVSMEGMLLRNVASCRDGWGQEVGASGRVVRSRQDTFNRKYRPSLLYSTKN